MTNKELISRYAADLEMTQIIMRLHHDRHWENILQTWRDEFDRAPDTVTLKTHAARTARALGGMHSIGDGISNDKVLQSLLDDLHAVCREIASSLP